MTQTKFQIQSQPEALPEAQPEALPEALPEVQLTVRQRRFVEAYWGNATKAARMAGYSDTTAKKQASRLMRTPAVAKALREREKPLLQQLVSDRQERQEFWTQLMRSQDEDIRNRIKASELLAKSEGDFLDRVELSSKVKLDDAIREGRERASRNE